jgi:hypothetical protein
LHLFLLWIEDGTQTYNRCDWCERQLSRRCHYHVLATVRRWLR